MIVHAGCIAAWTREGWRGAIIEGPSGSGKSDLALRLLDEGFRLVADDRTRLWRSEGRLFGAAPETLAGLLEARGVGILGEPALAMAEVMLKVVCLPPGAAPDRLPDPEAEPVLGQPLPVLKLSALEASAPAKLRRVVASLGCGAQGAYQTSAAISRAGGGSR